MDQDYTRSRPDYPQIDPPRRPAQHTAPVRRQRVSEAQSQETMPQRPQRELQAQAEAERQGVDKNIFSVLNRMEDQVSEAKKMPFSEQVLLDREEMLFMIRMIRENLPEELRQARWLLQQNRQLIAEARKEAEQIMREAEQQMTRMIDEHEVTQQAQEEARSILTAAGQRAKNIEHQVIDYAKNVLIDLEDQLTEMLVFIQRNKKEIEQ
ncbi:MAG: hypothetical protein Q4P08_03845 [Eubacteriales bacterium]|nr:hypothetical protein [Eubacteriales bacterium]